MNKDKLRCRQTGGMVMEVEKVKEIKKALEDHSIEKLKYQDGIKIKEIDFISILTLINELESENNELKNIIAKDQETCVECELEQSWELFARDKEIGRLRAEIERLTEEHNRHMDGTLVETPCKVGDTVYCVEYFCNYKGCSSDEQMFCCGCSEMLERERRKEKFVISKKKFRLQDLDRVGKTLFPTEEAAEARLKELQENEK